MANRSNNNLNAITVPTTVSPGIVNPQRKYNPLKTLSTMQKEAVPTAIVIMRNKNIPITPETVKDEVIHVLDNLIDVEVASSGNPKETKQHYKYNHELVPAQIGDLILAMYTVRCIRICDSANESSEDTTQIIGIYVDDPSDPEYGTYSTSLDRLANLIQRFCYSISETDIGRTMAHLRRHAPKVSLERDRDLVAVNNGIFNYKTKELMPFSPDHVYLTKSKVSYNPLATNIVIHNDDGTDWDVESWMDSISDDAEIVKLLWQILGAIVRPHVRWDKAAWFYATVGNNGKGTLCELMRELVGAGSAVTLSLDDMDKDFMLEPLLRATSIITDENDVGLYLDKARNLKAIITGDPVLINRKYKQALTFSFHGFMVQCINGMPRIRDKSDSFFRRQIFIPFDKCFTGKERKYIKSDYVHRQEVLEYVMYKVLNTNYYEFTIPEACRIAQEEYKVSVDPVRAFAQEILPELTWDLLPYDFLYDVYIAYYCRTHGNRNGLIDIRRFKVELIEIVNQMPDLGLYAKPSAVRPRTRMSAHIQLLSEYEPYNYALAAWSPMNLDRNLKKNYKGLVRRDASDES